MRLAIFLSGRGSNFISIKENIDNGFIPDTEISLVFSNNPKALGLDYAKNAGLKTVCIPSKDRTDRNAYDLEILEILKEHKIDLVCLAGYMRILTDGLVNAYAGRMMNIHPALLPSFKGAHAQKQALDYGVKFTGCTVHFVDAGVDTGAIIAQKVVPVLSGDTEESLSARILEKEHILYPEAVKAFAERRVKFDGCRAFIEDTEK